jgi:hypothetical protein
MENAVHGGSVLLVRLLKDARWHLSGIGSVFLAICLSDFGAGASCMRFQDFEHIVNSQNYKASFHSEERLEAAADRLYLVQLEVV